MRKQAPPAAGRATWGSTASARAVSPKPSGRAQGNRESIDAMAAGSAQVLQQVLRLIDAHDLYGSVAYPKKHTQKDISDIYLLPFATRGVFTNVALQEPFGLTVIEVRPACWSRSGRCFWCLPEMLSCSLNCKCNCMTGPCKGST